jgi:hypothetical protein
MGPLLFYDGDSLEFRVDINKKGFSKNRIPSIYGGGAWI